VSHEAEQRPRVFVLMPFDQEFAAIYEQLIKPSLEDVGYEVARADTLLTQQNILRDVIAGIAGASLVVADLTTLNPNVMYELGIAHGLQIPTVLIAQSIEDLPFDLRSYRVIQYSGVPSRTALSPSDRGRS
jgi:nucleoside 2-deoxyribosyltransferase